MLPAVVNLPPMYSDAVDESQASASTEPPATPSMPFGCTRGVYPLPFHLTTRFAEIPPAVVELPPMKSDVVADSQTAAYILLPKPFRPFKCVSGLNVVPFHLVTRYAVMPPAVLKSPTRYSDEVAESQARSNTTALTPMIPFVCTSGLNSPFCACVPTKFRLHRSNANSTWSRQHGRC